MSECFTYKETNLQQALEIVDWKRLVLNVNSGMGRIIRGVKKLRKKNIRVLLVYRKDEVVGWAWSFNYTNSNNLRRRGFMLYIKGPYRRKGLGTKCLKWGQKVAKEHHMKFICFPWNDESNQFFGNSKIKDKNQGWWL